MNYAGISECDNLNGIGFRTVLFVSACDHRCIGCHNKQTWNPNFGNPFTDKTLKYLLDCLSKPYIDGITLTGGDPLYKGNLETVLNIIQVVKKRCLDKTIWLYTGYTWEEICDMFSYNEIDHLRYEILTLCDVLVDGRFEIDKKDLTLPFRGSSNQRVIDVKQSISTHILTLYQLN